MSRTISGPDLDRAHRASAAIRNGRMSARIVCLDLHRTTDEIQRDLRALWPRAADLWWELDADEGAERRGFVYSGARVLARLVHGKAGAT